jgi:hypothetical protein
MNIQRAETMNRLMRDHQDNWERMSAEEDALENQHKGGSTDSQYKLPSGATQLQDLIEYRDMSFSLGNIFKACYRLGAKESVTVMYDLKKIQWFVGRMIAAEEDK